MDDHRRHDDDLVSLGQLFEAMLRYWWIILVGIVAGGSLGWFTVNGSANRYQASSQILVQESSGATITSSDLSTSEALASTYMSLITTRPVMDAAGDLLIQRDAPDALIGAKIDISIVPNTQIFVIKVTSEIPENAAASANALVDAFVDRTRSSRLAEIAAFQQAARAGTHGS
ncbi:MAG: Wzz/FepE/Etk N-terminal domain-containing protein [Pirellulaceae bacterium]|jgi:capsular polysaccharide biosynthesis protein|nr:Wzz/FepE/Etk N-terminal domain-containing protein [Pirellulaceae bacterium]